MLVSADSFENQGLPETPGRSRSGKNFCEIEFTYFANEPWQCIVSTSK